MGTAQIREILHEYINRADDRLLNLIYAMMQADLEEYELNHDQKAILEQRISLHHANPNLGSSWEEVKARIRKEL